MIKWLTCGRRIKQAMMAPTRQPLPVSADPEPLPLAQRHVEGALLYADRNEMVRRLGIPAGGAIAEVGVALGDFSEFLLATLQPKRFVAIDLWNMHEHPVIWGQPSEVLFKGMTQAQFYEARFKDKRGVVEMASGESHEKLSDYPDAHFDMIYVDAGHDYASVKKDAEVAASKVKPDGVLIFNDYIIYDHAGHGFYGIVQVVNRMVVEDGWKVAGFALQRHMFCDIALRRG